LARPIISNAGFSSSFSCCCKGDLFSPLFLRFPIPLSVRYDFPTAVFCSLALRIPPFEFVPRSSWLTLRVPRGQPRFPGFRSITFSPPPPVNKAVKKKRSDGGTFGFLFLFVPLTSPNPEDDIPNTTQVFHPPPLLVSLKGLFFSSKKGLLPLSPHSLTPSYFRYFPFRVSPYFFFRFYR